jgi:predicted metal-binding membrane protein
MTGGMQMPGHWAMSMAWMRMPGQSWAGSYLSFTFMWLVMMVAMMLPSLVPNLVKYRGRVAYFDDARAAALTAMVAAGYFAVWTCIGATAYPFGVAVAAQAMQSAPIARSEPFAAGAALVFAGWFQCSKGKTRQLERCRAAATCCTKLPRGMADAWRHGLRLGADCGLCCCGLMIALLALGVMNLAAMIAIAAAITVERVAERPMLPARLAGILLIALGSLALLGALGAAAWTY